MNSLFAFFKEHQWEDRGVYVLDRMISYRELFQRAVRFSAKLMSVRRHDPFIGVIWMENTSDLMKAFVAVVAAGGIPVPVHSYSTLSDVMSIYKMLKPDMILLSTSKLKALSGKVPDVHLVDAEKEDILHDHPMPRSRIYNPPVDTAIVLMSSGSTGKPKGIMLSSRNIESNVLSISNYTGLNDSDKVLISKSFGYSSTITGEWLLSLMTGANIQLTPGLLHPAQLMKYIRMYGITFACTVPAPLISLLKSGQWTQEGIGRLRQLLVVGGPIPPEIALTVHSQTPELQLVISYGLTEASPRVTYLPSHELIKRPSSVGIPIDGVKVGIFLAGSRVGPLIEGEIVVTGPNVMLGYFNDWDKTNDTICQQGLKTSDIGYLDEDGFLYVTGRMDNAMNVRGHTVYPERIENAMLACELVEEVAVTGIEDELWGQSPIAYVVPVSTNVLEQQIYKFCQEQLSPFLRPSHIYLVEQLPKTAIGKLNRQGLKTYLEESYGKHNERHSPTND